MATYSNKVRKEQNTKLVARRFMVLEKNMYKENVCKFWGNQNFINPGIKTHPTFGWSFVIPSLVQGEGNYVVTTDLGNEFRGLEGALPGGAVHRQKDPSDRNATAVVDRAIQTLKKDLAGMVARRGGGWGEHVDEAAEAYNARPHQAVTVAPENVETMPAATFRVYQDNARKFKHNDELTRSWMRRGRSGPPPMPSGPSSPSTGRCGRWRATIR